MKVGKFIEILENIDRELEIVIDDNNSILGVSVVLDIDDEPVAFIDTTNRK